MKLRKSISALSCAVLALGILPQSPLQSPHADAGRGGRY